MTAAWSLLGIEPTTDLVEIKRAYARCLKATRPEDDPKGYQALRVAYEFAQQQARAGRPITLPVEEDSVAVSPPIPDSAMHPEQATAADSRELKSTGGRLSWNGSPGHDEPELLLKSTYPEYVAVVSLPVLLEQCEARFKSAQVVGNSDLCNWLSATLNDLPLTLRDDASVAFARLTVRLQPPADVRAVLARHFEWGTDYRAMSVLGPALAAGVERLVGVARKPEFVERYQAAVAYLIGANSVTGWRRWMMWLFAAAQCRSRWGELDERGRAVLGIDADLAQRAGKGLAQTAVLRIGLVAVACATVLAWPGYSVLPFFGRLATVVFAGSVAYVVSWVAHAQWLGWRASVRELLQFSKVSAGSGKLPIRDWVSLALVAAAVWLAAALESSPKPAVWPGLTAVLVGVAGALATWPVRRLPAATPAILLTCTAVGWFWPAEALHGWTGAMLGALWFWVCANLFTYFRPGSEPTTAVGRFVQLLGVAIPPPALPFLRFTVGLPYTAIEYSVEGGAHAAMAACAITLAAVSPANGPVLLPIWLLATSSLFLLDALLMHSTTLAVRRPLKASWLGWLEFALCMLWIVWAILFLENRAMVYHGLGLHPSRSATDDFFRVGGLLVIGPALLLRAIYSGARDRLK